MKELHQAAPHHLPSFITGPGETDIFYIIATLTVLGVALGAGIFFFWLHSLPERMAHKAHRLQLDLIAVLCLLSLFTHVHLFWVIALVLAFVKVPDVSMADITGPIERIAGSLEKMSSAGSQSAPQPPASSEKQAPAATPPRDKKGQPSGKKG